MEALVMKQKNSLALWKWSHTLQYNVYIKLHVLLLLLLLFISYWFIDVL